MLKKFDLRMPTLCMLVSLAGGAPLVEAADLIVEPVVAVAADGKCSLLEAVVNSEADDQVHVECPKGDGADRLFLTPNFNYLLTQAWSGGQNGLPALGDDLEIIGQDASIGRASAAPAFRLAEINGGVFTFRDLTLENGFSTGIGMIGGAALWIHNSAEVSLIDSVLQNNRTEGVQGLGGAIRMDNSDLTVIDSQLVDNTAISIYAALGGGAIAQLDGTLLIQRSALLDNATDLPFNPAAPNNFVSTGGAIRVEGVSSGAITRIEDSTLAGNIGSSGGAINVVAIANTGAVPSDVLVELIRSTIVLNDAPSGQGDGVNIQQANGGDGIVLYGSSILIGNGIEVGGQVVGNDCQSNTPTQDFLSLDGNVLAVGGACTSLGFDNFAASVGSVVQTVRNGDHYLPLPGGPAVDFVEANSNCPLGSRDQLRKLRANGPGAGNTVCDAGAIELYQPINNRTLSVTLNGSGGGQVTSQPAGINCPGTCSVSFPTTTSVTLSQTANGGSAFGGWSGDCSGLGTCVVPMNIDRQVSATFDLLPVTLSVLIQAPGGASGSVQSTPAGIQCPGDCSQQYPVGTSVTLVASPGPGSQFANWAGTCSSQPSSTCIVPMTSTRTATAEFELAADILFAHGFDQQSPR